MAVTFTDGNLEYVHDSKTIDPTGETAAFAAEVANLGGDRFLVGFIRQLNISAPGWAPQDMGMRVLQVNNDLTVTPEALIAFDSEPIYVGRYRSPMVGVATDKVLLVGEQGIDAYTAPSFADDHLTAFLIDCSGALPTVSGTLEIDSTATSFMEFNTRGNSQIAVLSPTRAIVTSRGTRNISHDTAWVQLLDISGAAPVLLAGPTAVYVQSQFRNIQLIPVSATTAILVWLDWTNVGGTMRFSPRMQWMDVTGDTIQTQAIGYGPGPVVTQVGNPIVQVDDEPAVQADGYNYLGAVKSGPGNKIILSAQYYNGSTTTKKFLQVSYYPSDHTTFTIDSVQTQPAAPAGHTYTGDVRAAAGIVGVEGGALATRTVYDDSTFGNLERSAVYTAATQPALDFGTASTVSGAVDPLANVNDNYIFDHRMKMDVNPSTGRGIMTATDYEYFDASGDEFFSCFGRSFRTQYTAPPGGGGTGWGSDGVDGQWSVGQIAWH